MAAKTRSTTKAAPEAPAAMPENFRRCTGSARFGIEAHDAPIIDFPKQPSRKDGLGTMCAEHWKAYVKALRVARKHAAGDHASCAADGCDLSGTKEDDIA